MIATVTSAGTCSVNVQINNKTVSIARKDIPFGVKTGEVLIIQGSEDFFKIIKKAVNASVDSIEDGIAHLEIKYGECIDIPISEVSFRIAEGEILLLEHINGSYKIIGKNRPEMERRLERKRNLLEQIKQRQHNTH